MQYRLRQFRLLLWKNFLLQYRRPIGTIFEIVLPVVFVAILILARLVLKPSDQCFSTFQDTVNAVNLKNFQTDVRVYANDEKNRERKLKKLNINQTFIAYHPSTQELDELMQKVESIMNITTRTERSWKSEEDMADEVTELEGTCYGAVAFLGDPNKYRGNALPKDMKYAIRLPAQQWLNRRTYPFFKAREPQDSRNSLYSSRFVYLQYALDAAIYQSVANSTQPYKFILKQFPYPEYRKDYFNFTIGNTLPILLTLAFIYTAMMIVKELVYEKQCRLKESMKMMGLSNWLHWLAWFAKCFLFSLISIVLVTIILKAFKIFEHSHWSVIFVFLLLYMTCGIVFCFFISVFFSNAVLSMLFSGAIWFISYVPFSAVSNENTYEGLSSSAKSALCLLVNSALGIASKTISVYEERGVGVQWSNIGSSPSADDDFNMGQVFIMLVVDILVFGFLTWYIEAVFPGDYGIPQPPYFLFTKSYWCGSSSSKVDDSQDETAISNLHLKNPDYEKEPSDLQVGVSIRDIRKVFKSAKGKKIAVDHLSFNMYKGQITSLLGHNGAGKTTTMSVLTGLFPPTSGCAYINGYNILTEMDKIRESLGLCPQHNVLFDKLTVKEHLKFFVNLKGKFGAEAEREINSMIDDIQLSDKAHWQSRLLSGGMKRKLSCAIALVGGSEIVFLDEPTSGMDPYARRATWDLLQKYRAGKTIILTTHFMDEADFLGDRIAIMADGQLRCCGSSLFLKSRYGVGYRLTLVKAEKSDVQAIQTLIYNHVNDAQMVSDVGAELAFILRNQSSGNFETLFRELEDRRSQLGISSFGVSITTLEDVFIKVGEGMEHTVDDIAEAKQEDNESTSIELVGDPVKKLDPSELLKGIPLKIHQFKAMFMKRFIHSKRNKAAVITQLVLPLLFSICALSLAKTTPKVTNEPSRLLNFKNLSVDGKITQVFFADNFPNATLNFTNVSNYLQTMSSSGKDITSDVNQIRGRNTGSRIYVDGKYTTANNRESCCKFKYQIINEHCKELLQNGADVPNAPKTGKNATCTPLGYQDCSDCMIKCDSKTSPPPIRETALFDFSTYYQEYVLSDSDPAEYFFDHIAGFLVTKHHTDVPVYTSWYSNEGVHTIAGSVNVMSNLILQSVDDSYSITAYNHPLPYSAEGKSDNVTGDFSALLLAIFLNFGMSFLVASFITFIILERESKAKHIQFISGVDTISFWTATYAWDFLNYMVPATLILVLFAMFQIDAYNDENLGVVFLLLILQGLSAIPFVYCLSYFFKSPLVGYALTVLLLAFVSLGLLIAVFIVSSSDQEAADIIKYISLLIPTYAFSNSFLDINKNYGFKKYCTSSTLAQSRCKLINTTYVDNSLDWDDFGVGKQCLYMFLEAIVYFTLCLLLQVNFFMSARTHHEIPSTNDGEPEDQDVATERRRVNELDLHNLTDAVVLKNMSKVYPGATRTAVDNLSLGISKGNCFGLLGINGAGKTTTFAMLTGEFPISAGTAYLDGYNIQTQLRQVQQRIGYCPQFDALVEKLTGREMLEMYAHLRGVPSSKIKDLVDSTIVSLNLGKWADKMCGTYSGGNKRKLSTAIALVGNPPIVFLDEPTTGMDPGARRFLWNYLTSVIRGGRSIVLTSHSWRMRLTAVLQRAGMEECEALCTQLAIMVNGKFKCLGGIQHLKSRFGSGYTLMLKISPSEGEDAVSSSPPSPIASLTDSHGYFNPNLSQPVQPVPNQPGVYLSTLDGFVEQAKLFVQQTFPGAILQDSRQGMLTYQIVGDNLKWSYIFGKLEKSRARLKIVDYSVSQTTLEQVFLNFAKHQFSEERTKYKKKRCFCF